MALHTVANHCTICKVKRPTFQPCLGVRVVSRDGSSLTAQAWRIITLLRMHDIMIAWHPCASYIEIVCTQDFHTLMTSL